MQIKFGKTYNLQINESDKIIAHMVLAFIIGIITYGLMISLPLYVLWNYFIIDLVKSNVFNHLSLLNAFLISIILTLQIKVSNTISLPTFDTKNSNKDNLQTNQFMYERNN